LPYQQPAGSHLRGGGPFASIFLTKNAGTFRKVLNLGAKKEFVNHVTVEEQYFRYRLTPEQIVSDILNEI